MNYTDIQARLAIIKSLPISELDKRQPLLAALVADIVNHETCDGSLTDGGRALERQDWWCSLGALMKDAGFILLGNGHFSAAYWHEMLPGRVIKVGFKKEDSGAAYTAFCRMHQGRAGIPNIHHVARHAGCYTVVLDKLLPCNTRGNDTHSNYACAAREFIECSNVDADDFTQFVSMEFIETCKMIREFFYGIASFDMHSGNIMFDKNDVAYITDPVSFSHDRKRSDAFPLDPDALIAEVEAIANERLIERCRQRKAKRDPNGAFRANRKASMKLRMKHRKHFRMMEKREALRMIDHRAYNRNQRRAEMMLGFDWHNFWLNNKQSMVRKVEQEMGLKWQVGERMAIIKGRSLPIDRYLDARLQG